MSSAPDRAVLRRELRQRRRDLPAATRIAAAESLANRLLALPLLPSSGHVAGYWAMDGEIGLHVFQLRLPPALTYCLPLLHADESLRFAPWRAGDPLVTNRFGIPEPDIDPDTALPASDMAMLVLPLVGFDARCNRLGMGGGWYDRSLAFRHARRAPPLFVGAAFAVQQCDAIPMQPWDVRLDAVCSEATAHFSEDIA
ncbi:5-formyltetrahydrofolate cyclo-ligase [Thermomonas carbonis]|uniref:5-formyltetrahydrofolate cyclo-ligase n=1 Tax=Thermomonas carbonis TaxID=1463158 RepID=A0A7G9SRL8_9GAMM|nr:5-formyltetrahydrofolate cyclo-ligase [Thermomonas carbonis]QNN70493.1 5-formyltetrahydrofolate cyclo-ligase [Thermomonas carbonis]GHC00395.1 5-formyltetrahydrofolate cyclo-ligase [Thermomonas carbonis]